MSVVGQKESESASPWYVFLIFLHQSSSPCSPLTQHLSCSVTLVDITSDHDVNVEILSSAPHLNHPQLQRIPLIEERLFRCARG